MLSLQWINQIIVSCDIIDNLKITYDGGIELSLCPITVFKWFKVQFFFKSKLYHSLILSHFSIRSLSV